MRLVYQSIIIIILLVGLFYADTLYTIEYQSKDFIPDRKLFERIIQSDAENTDKGSVSTDSDTADIVILNKKLPNNQNKKPVTVLGWIPHWDQEKAYASFREQVDLFNFVSVFWYYIDNSGTISKYTYATEDQSIIDFAHNNGVKVLAVIANLPDFTEGGDWDFRRVNRVINSSEAREKHIINIIELVHRHEFDGINIDYEALPRSQRDNFTLFIKELGSALHAEGKILGVAIHPKTSENNPSEDNGSAAQDWEALYPSIDQLYFMTYGEHYSESQPGPIASISWVADILTYAIDIVGVPREKIFLGTPLYAQEWHETSSNDFEAFEVDLPYENIKKILIEYNADMHWDNGSQSPYLTYGSLGNRHIIWYENSKSFKAKLDVGDMFNIPNFALWRLGIEDPTIWTVLRERVSKR